MRIGIKSVSMDDIAREVSVSKKTIYKYFENKKDLIGNVIKADIDVEMNACKDCYNTEGNAIQKMIDISRHISHRHKNTNPTIIFDLQKYYPAEWELMEDFRTNFIQNTICDNVKEGKSEGLYRAEIDENIVCQLYVSLMHKMINMLATQEEPFNFRELHFEMVTYHLHGICTEKGKDYLEQHINEITN